MESVPLTDDKTAASALAAAATLTAATEAAELKKKLEEPLEDPVPASNTDYYKVSLVERISEDIRKRLAPEINDSYRTIHSIVWQCYQRGMSESIRIPCNIDSFEFTKDGPSSSCALSIKPTSLLSAALLRLKFFDGLDLDAFEFRLFTSNSKLIVKTLIHKHRATSSMINSWMGLLPVMTVGDLWKSVDSIALVLTRMPSFKAHPLMTSNARVASDMLNEYPIQLPEHLYNAAQKLIATGKYENLADEDVAVMLQDPIFITGFKVQ